MSNEETKNSTSEIIENFLNKPEKEYKKYMREMPKKCIMYKEFFDGRCNVDDYIGCYVYNGHWSTFDNIRKSRHKGFCEVYFLDSLGNEYTEFCRLDESITLIYSQEE